MNYGFIYCLGNPAMPGIFKIGMTERAPAQRCLELSGSTSAPFPFDILCFGQVEEPRSTEAEIHEAFAAVRVNECRDFFRGPYSDIRDVIKSYSEGFAETNYGGEALQREDLMAAFLLHEDIEQKAMALIEAARFEGITFYRDGNELRMTGLLLPSSWISGAVHMLRRQLVSLVPEKKQGHLAVVAAKVSAEEIDW